MSSKSSNTIKLYTKYANNLIKDFIEYLEDNQIYIPQDIQSSFLVDKPSKRKGKLTPYTMYMKEYRSNYQKTHPEMSFQEVSQAIALEWQRMKENPEKLKEYDEKAEKYNREIKTSNKKNKKICKATKGSDKTLCQAEAKFGDYCGRHKKLAVDQVLVDDDILSNISNDYISCQKQDCSQPAMNGPFCSEHKIQQQKQTCKKEKPNGQLCGKKATKGEYCGFHGINKNEFKIRDDTTMNSETDNETESTEKIMYYDKNFNIYNSYRDNSIKFLIYDDEIAYNEEGEEIGIIINNKIDIF